MDTTDYRDAHNPEDIYCYQPDKPEVDTALVFTLTTEGDKLRVRNNHVHCLFSHLTAESFKTSYNDFARYLNLNFLPLSINGRNYQLSGDEMDYLEQHIITSLMYFYDINDMTIVVKRTDFKHLIWWTMR